MLNEVLLSLGIRIDLTVSRVCHSTPAEYVVSIVQKMVKDGNYGADHSIAFIYRTNAQSRALEEACVRFNLPYVIHGASTSFYKRQEIKDSLCYLRWLYNGRDRAAMLRSFVTPKRGLGDKAIEKFDEYCSLVDQLWKEQYPDLATPSALEVLYYLSGDESWISQHEADFPPPSLTFPKRTLVAFCDFSKEMVVIRELAERDPIEKVLSYVVEKLKLVPYWDSISKSVEEFEERKGNVQELIQASSRYSKYGPCLSEPDTNEEIEFAQSPLARFLDDVSLVTDMADSGERSSDDRMVANMMTSEFFLIMINVQIIIHFCFVHLIFYFAFQSMPAKEWNLVLFLWLASKKELCPRHRRLRKAMNLLQWRRKRDFAMLP